MKLPILAYHTANATGPYRPPDHLTNKAYFEIWSIYIDNDKTKNRIKILAKFYDFNIGRPFLEWHNLYSFCRMIHGHARINCKQVWFFLLLIFVKTRFYRESKLLSVKQSTKYWKR